jgi:fatty-acyl-CoA synthase
MKVAPSGEDDGGGVGSPLSPQDESPSAREWRSLRLPSRAGTAAIGAQVQIGAVRTPDRSALEIFGGRRRSYAELHERTNRLAQALLGVGLEKGSRVGIWLTNCLEYMDIYIACAKANLVVVQVNIRHKGSEASFQLANSECQALFYGETVRGFVEELALGDSMRLVVGVGCDLVKGAVAFETFLESGANVMPTEPSDDDLLVIGYTSGTTGFPKGAELTHRSVKTLGQTNAITNRYVVGSTQIFGLSLSFSAGIPAHVLPHMYVGGTTIILGDWNTEELVDAIEAHRATFSILPSPPIVDFCHLVEKDIHRLDTIVSLLHSSSKAPPEHLEMLVNAIGPRLVEGWGMTENSGGLIAATVASDYQPRRPGIFESTGRAAPDAVIRLIDEEGNLLPHDNDAVGQLVAHSGSLARGYWKNAEASAATFRDGWYYSGDLGRIDPDGYVTIIDRRPDLIVSGGMNVYPSEVERVILTLPGIRDCAVVATAHERWGQTPVAFITLSNHSLTVEDVLAYCGREMAGYKIPTKIFLVDDLPRNVSGKVLRRELRALLEGDATAESEGSALTDKEIRQ